MIAWSEEWSRRKAYLVQSMFGDVPAFSPVAEEQASGMASPGAARASSSSSPLPELIIEREPNRHDESDEFYQELARKVRSRLRELNYRKCREGSDGPLVVRQAATPRSRSSASGRTDVETMRWRSASCESIGSIRDAARASGEAPSPGSDARHQAPALEGAPEVAEEPITESPDDFLDGELAENARCSSRPSTASTEQGNSLTSPDEPSLKKMYGRKTLATGPAECGAARTDGGERRASSTPSPLPELIIEREPNRHDESEEFYLELARKVRSRLKEMNYRKLGEERETASDETLVVRQATTPRSSSSASGSADVETMRWRTTSCESIGSIADAAHTGDQTASSTSAARRQTPALESAPEDAGEEVTSEPPDDILNVDLSSIASYSSRTSTSSRKIRKRPASPTLSEEPPPKKMYKNRSVQTDSPQRSWDTLKYDLFRGEAAIYHLRM